MDTGEHESKEEGSYLYMAATLPGTWVQSLCMCGQVTETSLPREMGSQCGRAKKHFWKLPVTLSWVMEETNMIYGILTVQ